MLPHRTRSQIRAHYRYLSKNIKANASTKGTFRRVKIRGRPVKGSEPPNPNEFVVKMQECIQNLESKTNNQAKQKLPTTFPVIPVS